MTTLSEAALILAPQGRDALLASSLLAELGIQSHICSTVGGLVAELTKGGGFGLVTEESIATADLKELSHWISAQPEWSDFPFIVLTKRGGGLERNPAAGRYLEMLGNVTFMERPFHPTSLISLAQSALRARRRQYEARTRLETIRLGEQRLKVALDAGRLGTWALDAVNAQLETSETCKAHYGRVAAEPFSFEQLFAAVHPDDLDAMQAAVSQSQQTGDDYDIEYRCIWPDNSVHWISLHGRVERDNSGNMVRMVGVSQDVTERRTNEEALRALAADLEQRVEERTREHERITAQLHEAQKLETLGQLTGGVAHDFNNLLMPIMAAMDIMHRRASVNDPQSTKLLAGALQSAERAKTLVQRLLGFARRAKLETMAMDIGILLHGMSDLIKSSIGPDIKLSLDVDEACQPAQADPNQLELALLNLCVNARDAMPQGGSLRLSVRSENGGLARRANLLDATYIVISVSDSGSGMGSETMNRAIEPFYSTKEFGRGTGLGLSMVHGLAAQLNGAFILKSKLGEGTTASLWLPEATASASNRSRPDTHAMEFAQLPATCVLLVDDEPIVRMATAEMLRDLGHDVIEAAGGNEALGHVNDGLVPGILITDYKMPGMDGPRLISQMKQKLPKIPVLLITGYGGAQDSYTEAVRLSKPFSQADLAHSMEAALQHSGAADHVGVMAS